MNTPLLQRLAMKQLNESQGGSPALKKSAPKTKSSTPKPSTISKNKRNVKNISARSEESFELQISDSGNED